MAFTLGFAPVNSCVAVECPKCGKTTWKGCGQHIERALKDVKEEDRCTCSKEDKKEEETK